MSTQGRSAIALSGRSIFSPPARFWIEIVALVSAIACALALMLATVGAVAGAGVLETAQSTTSVTIQSQTYEGIITDAHCGARHSAAASHTAADCTRVCIHRGERFVLVDGDRTYFLEGELAALQQAAGQRVKIVGTLNGRKISVTSVVAA